MRLGLAAIVLTTAVSGCVSASQAPAWFEQQSAVEDASYPTLRSVPRETIANTDQAHWEAVEADLVAAGQALKSNPRAAPASATESPAEFLEEAREDLEESRQSHEPN